MNSGYGQVSPKDSIKKQSSKATSIKLTGQTSDVQLFPVIHSKATIHMHNDLDGDSNEDEEAMFGELE